MFESTDQSVGQSRDQILADLRRRLDRSGVKVPAAFAGAPSAPAPVRVAESGSRPVLPVAGPLGEVLPRGGLPRGGVVTVSGGATGVGATSLLFTLLAGCAPAAAGAWTALVGMPGIGLAAAAEFGLDLDRLVLIPDPGPDLLQVVSILVDGVELVVVHPPPGLRIPPARIRVLTGRLRQHGAVLLVTGAWPGADLTLTASIGEWAGLGQGHGRLRDRELTVQVGGRGLAARGGRTTVLLRGDRDGIRVLPAQSAGSVAGDGASDAALASRTPSSATSSISATGS
ncbi:hypothetical protein [Nakamurella leprariae]|uniref:Uncharacterized protein n=1 Tax=Nakamurella leprariae TaxID=2803911 RepID=A0A938Y6F2_9ACTN|nr:hypothetical protein [Nakamurella leprariae]MBM9466891.1 hypothetical protein [Nakamurella leprariae]